jgi:hypothetical protein
MKYLYFLLVLFYTPILLQAQHHAAPLKVASINRQAEKQEWSAFRAQTASVRNFTDYCALVERFPTVRAAVVSMRGGEKAHRIYIAKAKKYTWRIYRNTKGNLSFFRADLPILSREHQCGLRIDQASQY